MKLSEPNYVNYLKIISCGYQSGGQPADFKFQYSDNDGLTWEDLLSVDGLTQAWWNTPADGSEHEWEIPCHKRHSYYRLLMGAKTTGVSFNIQEMEIGYKE